MYRKYKNSLERVEIEQNPPMPIRYKASKNTRQSLNFSPNHMLLCNQGQKLPTNVDSLLPQIARMPKITAQPFVNKLSLSQKRHLDKLIDQQKMQFMSMDF